MFQKFQGFSKLTRSQRFQKLLQEGLLTEEDIQFLKEKSGLDVDLAESLIENVIGYFHLPLGVAPHFVIDKKEYLIPMAVEETSIIAAASKTARWIRQQNGEIVTEVIGREHIGQIQIPKVKNFEKLEDFIKKQEKNLIQEVNEKVAYGLVRRGGGVRKIVLRKILRADNETMAVFHVEVDTCNAMGANAINQIVEYLKRPIEEQTGEKVGMCILSNLVDTKVVKARVFIKDMDSLLAEKIEEASLFAEYDPYRAATHNKGVLNGIDAVLIATGNDWRAVEAGVHAYAAKNGTYQPVTQWRRYEKGLMGVFKAPLITATVGGVTHIHPIAKIAFKILKITSAEELSRVCAAVGLVQNLGALRALVTKGIIEGHMKLHIKNLVLSSGAQEEERDLIEQKLEKILAFKKRVSISDALDVLREIRG